MKKERNSSVKNSTIPENLYRSKFLEAVKIVSDSKNKLGFMRKLAIRAAILAPAFLYAACAARGNNDEDSLPKSFASNIPNAASIFEPSPSPTFEIVSTPTPTPELTLEPTPQPIPSPTPEPTLEPTPEPPQVDLSICQPQDTKKEGTLYVTPNIGVKKRVFPSLDSVFNGGTALNTELLIECERDTDGGVWFRVNSSYGEFWISQLYTSNEPVSVPTQTTYTVPPDNSRSEIRPGDGNKIILTFDDSGMMEQILDILDSYGAKAIFFPTGDYANSVPDIIQRAEKEGHLVCNHTKDHADLTTLSGEGVKEEILGGAGVGECNFLRPPYGAHNNFVDSIAESLGYTIFMWDIDTMDWARRYPGGDQEILNIALSQAYPGAVILMHMHVPNTIIALPAILKGLKDAGYELHW